MNISAEPEARVLLEKTLKEAVWAAHTLFARNKASGSSANISFRIGDTVYISASGTCFGTLTPEDFVAIRTDGTPADTAERKTDPASGGAASAAACKASRKPSKEWPLHTMLYEKDSSVNAVIHTHSAYAVLWSFVPAEDETDCIPPHTPYLRMKLGTVGLVPYEKPGSEALFRAFRDRVQKSDGFLLRQHGPVVPGKSMLDAFYNLEELEDSARIAWELRNAGLS